MSVFISYSRRDEAVARRLASALEKRGLTVWYDAHLPAHRAYSETIEQQLHAAEAVVVLWSADAAKSQWVRAEADVARTRGTLVQARLDDTVPPLPFNQIQCAELKGWRGSERHPGYCKMIDSIQALATPGEPPAASAPVRDPRHRRWWALGLAALLLAALAGLFAWQSGDSADRPVVAVLPFENQGSGDDGLADGLWEDTRQAIGRNPQLLVLGAYSAQELAEKDSKSVAAIADYVVSGQVRSAGDRIRVSVGLVRTDDQSEIWSETFERKLDDVFALQSEIAREIEGRIRGRLAVDGGTRDEQIATSGEVYALYSQAREKLKRRGMEVADAHAMLEKVVRLDPNFAPGWAALSVAERYRPPTGLDRTAIQGTAEDHARRAIALAPNLAKGHAALALADNLEGPVAEQSLRRAIALDPNDVETLNWLANVYNIRGDKDRAIALYRRAAEIEPLWSPPQINLIRTLFEDGRQDEVDEALRRIRETGGPLLIVQASMMDAINRGDLSGAARLGLRFLKSAKPDDRAQLGTELAAILVQLGHLEQAEAVSDLPPFALPSWKNDPAAIPLLDDPAVSDSDFWRIQVLPHVAGRAMLNNDQAARLVKRYDGIDGGPQGLQAAINNRLSFIVNAPTVALALARVGREDEATALLSLAHDLSLEFGPPSSHHARIMHARILAVGGRYSDAARLVEEVVDDGWRPAISLFLPDLRLDPALALLDKEPAFRRARQRIEAHFARERRALGPVDVAGL